MVNEWVKVDADDISTRTYTIGDNVPASKGQLLQLLDARVASGARGAKSKFTPVAGVAAEEHLPGVGETSIGVWTEGIFNATASNAITIGAFCAMDGNDNLITASCANESVATSFALSNSSIRALAVAADGDIINVRLSC